MNITVTGIDKVKRNLRSIERRVKQAARDAIEGEIDQISTEARSAVPVRTGRLKRSHRKRVDVTMTGVHGQVGFGKGAPYAAPVNKRTGFFEGAVSLERFKRRLERKVRGTLK